MAREPTVEAQLEAARILCDLSLDMGLQQTLVDHGVMDVLRELISSSPSEWAQQHAIAALSTLSDAQIFQVCARALIFLVLLVLMRILAFA